MPFLLTKIELSLNILLSVALLLYHMYDNFKWFYRNLDIHRSIRYLQQIFHPLDKTVFVAMFYIIKLSEIFLNVLGSNIILMVTVNTVG